MKIVDHRIFVYFSEQRKCVVMPSTMSNSERMLLKVSNKIEPS